MTVDMIKKLREQGWYLSEQGYDLASDHGNISDLQKIIKRASELDLREIGSGEGDINQGNIVLQIQKVRNVSAPKNNEESRAAPRMLKISLTDGRNSYQAVEIEHISCIGLNTPPGTKFLLCSGAVPMLHGIILLKSCHVAQMLSGKVSSLVEKWELNKKLALHTRVRSAEEGGPPPWIPFGKKIVKVTDKDKNFKALAEKEKSSKENQEFEAQRKDAIAEAAKQGSKKIFGGGNKQLLDHNVQKIVDQGFSIEQAEFSLKVNRNNVDKALKSLQQRNDNGKHNNVNSREPREPRGKRFEKKVDDGKPSSGKISLFHFLENKLPAQTEVEGASQQQPTAEIQNEKTESHYEPKTHDHGQSGRGGRAQKGARGYGPSEAKTNKRSTSSHNATNQYTTYNSNNTSQTRGPRFQKSQESYAYYQQDNNYKGNYQRSSQLNEYSRNTYPQPRTEYNNENTNYNRNDQGKHLQSNKNYNQVENDTRSKPSYNRTQQQSEGSHRGGYNQTYTSDKNYKNQLNRYPPQSTSTDNNSNGATNSNHQKTESFYNSHRNFPAGNWVWQKGDKCMAKYWEDNMYYNAEVTAVSDRTCVVQFTDFNNYEEVLQIDCVPITEDIQQVGQDYGTDTRKQDHRFGNRQPRYDQSHNHLSGMEIRRSGDGTAALPKGYNKKRSQQRNTQPIYQPPAQRGGSSGGGGGYTNIPQNTLNHPPL